MLKRYTVQVSSSLLYLAALPLVAFANGDHAPGEDHPPLEESAGLDPVTLLIGIVLAINIGFAVWVFMRDRNRTVKPPDPSRKSPRD